jgi:TatD DNase family protein
VTDAVIEWFDSHCHLQDEFAEAGGRNEEPGRDGPHVSRLAATIARASESGVTRMVCVGTTAATSRAAIELVASMRHPDSVAVAEGVALWATVGLHPHDAVDGVDSLADLLATHVGRTPPGDRNTPGDEAAPGDQTARTGPLVVGIGECGLDYHYDHSPRATQRETFAAQIELARRHDLALVIHTREAWDDTIDILSATGVPERTVIHCFTGGPAEARRCLDLGASLSFSGVVTFKNASEVREAAALCPLDRLLVETDSPFLAPAPHRGTLNEPSRVPLIGSVIAQVRGSTTGELARAATLNTLATFAL